MGESANVSDAERDQAMRALWDHLGTGRLTPGQHEERCARAAAATTRAELEALFADLQPDPPERSTLGDVLTGVGVLVAPLGLAAAIILTGDYGMWWTFFPVIGLTILCFVLSDVVSRKRD